jgi:hypothetical protein
MTVAMVQLIINLGTLILLMSLLATAGLKFFARPLTVGQAFIISVFSFSISTVLIALYYYVKASMGLAPSADAVAGIVMLVLSGVLITQRAQTYGIKKTGWLGVGGKTILALIALSWVLVGLYVLITFLMHP